MHTADLCSINKGSAVSKKKKHGKGEISIIESGKKEAWQLRKGVGEEGVEKFYILL